MDRTTSSMSISVWYYWAVSAESRASGQRPSQQGFNSPSECSAVSEIPQENSVGQPSPDGEPSCTSHYERWARHLTAIGFLPCVSEPDHHLRGCHLLLTLTDSLPFSVAIANTHKQAAYTWSWTHRQANTQRFSNRVAEEDRSLEICCVD